ncbi:hypothetical protein CTKA_01736 [Chthonomonas calidirosea]|uniref:Uncharacterized protein n=1 Tax=Chthonomonas calidirosea (strain DSM 23976 / ICMP 18418 / T49) TaxID=1303518 RepID=S0EWA7_CHTCT|nr:hypothetical protein [Chthonomonas calidirosea]CCW36164.1 hypothetical protein CCALI_02360 [Chthonomonas calidirosea T49]CEK18150.1 hypothetical protein CTKA_01736 [Chthonomonas calidirosea]
MDNTRERLAALERRLAELEGQVDRELNREAGDSSQERATETLPLSPRLQVVYDSQRTEFRVLKPEGQAGVCLVGSEEGGAIQVLDACGRVAVVVDATLVGGRMRIYDTRCHEVLRIEVDEEGGLIECRMPQGGLGVRLRSREDGGEFMVMDGERGTGVQVCSVGGSIEVALLKEGRLVMKGVL